MRKFYLPLFTLFICFVSINVYAYDIAVANADGKTIYYNYINNATELAVTSGPSSSRYTGVVAIPATVVYGNNTYNVTSIGSTAFCWCSDMTSITLPLGLTMIGNNAFQDCTGLTSVTIPDGVKTIGHNAFSGCSNLVSVDIPNSVTKIEIYAFMNCVALESVIIPGGVESIGSVFYRCSGLTTVTILDGLKTIDLNAFYECSSLTSVSIPESVTSIGAQAFDGCTNLSTVTIPSGVTSIGQSAFRGCSGLTSVNILGNVTTIGYSAFSGCSGIKSIDIPNSVDSIGDYAFQRCKGIQSIVIPNNVKTIGNCTFSGCSGLTSVDIPNSVTSIENYAFYGCIGLMSVTIPNSVITIGENAFSQCTGLASIMVESGNPNYDSRENCNAIIETETNTLIWGCNNTIIPHGVNVINDYAFCDCKELSSVTIPNTVTSIGEGAFKGCNSLTSIVLPNGLTSIKRYTFSDCNNLTSINIPNCVNVIGDYAFESCKKLASVTIPDHVTSVGECAFWGCIGLTSITISNSVSFIGTKAFEGTAWYGNQPDGMVYAGNVAYKYKGEMPANTQITLKEGTLGITGEAFDSCEGLISISIPNSVTSIGINAFDGTAWYDNQPDGLVYAGNVAYKYKGKMPANTQITLKEGTLGITGEAFDRCEGLISVSIPNSVTSIGFSAFLGCIGLKSVTIPNSVITIGEEAFSGCSGLTSIEIPNSVTSIGDCAFLGCISLVSITVGWEKPIEVYSYTFENDYAATLYVPAGCKSAYESADYWKNFRNILEPTQSTIISFKDVNVKAICIANWDTNGDNELDTKEASLVSDLGDVFEGNEEITSFDELQYFTGLTSIPSCAFNGCNKLLTITIPQNVTSIESEAFSWCESLTSVTIPNSVTSIGDWIFDYCSGLTSVFIGSGVSSIGIGIFNNCISLTSIKVDSNNLIYDSRDNCNAIIETNTNTLFRGCKGTIIPSSVTSIGRYGFEYSYGLTSINIPNNITSIGYSAFNGCKDLTSVIIGSLTPLTIDNNTFSNRYNATLYVPEGCVETYKAANYWKEFKNIKETVVSIEYDDICYNILSYIDKTVEVTSREGKYSGNLKIPSAVVIDNVTYSVIRIGKTAFNNCSDLTSITIPNSVTSIGDNAFKGCRLMFVTSLITEPGSIPNDVFDSDSYATMTLYVPAGCIDKYKGTEGWDKFLNYLEGTAPPFVEFEENNIRYILNSPNSVKVTYIIGQPYEGNFIIPASVTYEGYTFTVTEIVQNAFSYMESSNSYYDNTNLISVFIPKSVTSIPRSAFWGCISLNSIKIEDGNPKYDSRDGCNAIIETASNTLLVGCNGTVIPNGVTIIGYTAFEFCDGLTSINIPNGVLSIDDRAFQGCDNLTSIYISNSVTSIGDGAFRNCYNLNSVSVTWDEPISISSDVFSNCPNAILYVPSGCVDAYKTANYWKEFKDIKEACVNIEDDVICYNILSETDKTVEVIAGKEKYTGSLDIPSAVVIENVPYSVIQIGNYAFEGCSNLTSITIPNSVVSIGKSVFSGCSGLTSIKIKSGNPKYDSRNDCNAIIETSLNKLIKGCKTTVIPNSVETIGQSAFSGCKGLASIIIPNSVTSIDDWVFDYCSDLTSVTIGSCVTSIGMGIFNNCSSLTSIIVENDNPKYDSRDNCNAIIETLSNTLIKGCKGTIIPNSVTSIGNSAFEHCSGLNSITIPYGVISIGESAFYICTELSSISIPNSVTSIGSATFEECSSLTSVVIPNSVTSIGASAFKRCSGLSTISIPNGVGSIGDETFSGCNGLTSVSIPNSVTSIGEAAFKYCYNITSISIPNNVTTIKDYAFDGCNGLSFVTVNMNQPISISDNVFSNSSNAILYVPYGSKSAYSSADNWIEFKDIREFSENGFIISANEIFKGTNLWAGYVSQEDLALPEELEAYIITDLGTTTATAYPIDYIPESEPVLLKRENTTIGSFEMLPGTGTAPTMNLLKTYTTDKIVSNREGFVLYNDEFVLVNEGTLPAGCVFLPANTTVVALTRSIIINGDDATEIENTKVDNDVPKDQWYDFQGRKLERKPVKSGIYILNGRKVVVKY